MSLTIACLVMSLNTTSTTLSLAAHLRESLAVYSTRAHMCMIDSGMQMRVSTRHTVLSLCDALTSIVEMGTSLPS